MIDIGIIGAGGISETHARAAEGIAGARIAAVWGQNRDKARRLGERYGAIVYDDLPGLLAHDKLDLVLIGSPSGLHAEHGIAAARRGLHVLVEKPIDISTARADDLIRACEQASVRLGVFFQDRMQPDLCELKRFIAAGGLGRLILVSAKVKWFRPPEYYSASRWRGTRELDGGGALINQGIHTVDLLLWLIGDARRVSARTTTSLHDIAVEDTCVAWLEFACGALATLEAATSAYPGYARRVEVTGTEGTIIVEHDRVIAVDLRVPVEHSFGAAEAGDRNTSATSAVVSDAAPHRRVLEDFLRAMRDGDAPACDGREGRRSIRVVEAIYESAHRDGSPVEIIN